MYLNKKEGVPMLLHIGLGSDCLGGGRDLASPYAILGYYCVPRPTQASTTYPPSTSSTEDMRRTNMESSIK
jgi:hypothetical protein